MYTHLLQLVAHIPENATVQSLIKPINIHLATQLLASETLKNVIKLIKQARVLEHIGTKIQFSFFKDKF